MKHASFPTTIASAVPVTAPSIASPKASARWSLYQWLLDTLHHSRRLQAQRAIAQYRHLIARPETADTKSNTAESTQVGD
jgi:hypothetical protein